MSQLSKPQLLNWLHKQIHPGTKQKTPIREIVLRQVRLDGNDDQLSVYPIEQGGSVDIEELATEIIQEATQDAENLGGPQRYVLRPFYGEDPTPMGRFVFLIDGGAPLTDGDVSLSEAPDSRGITSMLMRHTESSHKSSLGAMAGIIHSQQKYAERLEERIRGYESAHARNVQLAEELASQKHQRDLETLRMQAAEKRKDEALQMMMKVAPMLIDKATGAGGMLSTMLGGLMGGKGGGAGGLGGAKPPLQLPGPQTPSPRPQAPPHAAAPAPAPSAPQAAAAAPPPPPPPPPTVQAAPEASPPGRRVPTLVDAAMQHAAFVEVAQAGEHETTASDRSIVIVMAALIESIQPEQMMKLAEAFDPTQLGLLNSIYVALKTSLPNAPEGTTAPSAGTPPPPPSPPAAPSLPAAGVEEKTTNGVKVVARTSDAPEPRGGKSGTKNGKKSSSSKHA